MSLRTVGVAVAVERNGRRRAKLLAHLGQAHVLRPEVVSPEAEAVGFINHQQLGLELWQQSLKRGGREAFGREIQQPIEALLQATQHL